MRHRKQRHKLSRDSAHRKALFSTMSKQLIQYERIETTQPKAKALKPEFEKLITLAKRGDLHARRQALSKLGQDKFAVHKLFEEIAPRYSARSPRPRARSVSWTSSIDLRPKLGIAFSSDSDLRTSSPTVWMPARLRQL